jgi:hypothetical protein
MAEKGNYLIERLESLQTHNVYRAPFIADLLQSAGIEATVADSGSVLAEGTRLDPIEPDWGEPGISPHAVLVFAYRRLLGVEPRSEMTGRGFWYRDVLKQLKAGLSTRPANER